MPSRKSEQNLSVIHLGKQPLASPCLRSIVEIFAILSVFACCISDLPSDHRSVPITQTFETSNIQAPVARLTGNAPGRTRSNLYVFRQSRAFARHQTQSLWTRISSSDTGAGESDTSRTRRARRHRQRTNRNR